MCRNESFTFQVNGDTKTMHATIYDHKTLGKDKALGEADIDVRVVFSVQRTS